MFVEAKKYVYKNKKTGKYFSSRKDYYSIFKRENIFDSKKLTDAVLFSDYIYYPEYEHYITKDYDRILFSNEERKIKLKTLNKKSVIKLCRERVKSILSISKK